MSLRDVDVNGFAFPSFESFQDAEFSGTITTVGLPLRALASLREALL